MDEIFLDLNLQGREKSEKLVRLLYGADIPENWMRFEKLKGSWVRREDKEITSIDQFFEQVSVWHSSMAVGRKEDSFTELNVLAISVLLTGDLRSDKVGGGSRYLQYCCPYNDENYARVNELFKKVYGVAIEDFKFDA